MRAICYEEEKWVKKEVREKSQIPAFDGGNVGPWLWGVWGHYLAHGTPEAQRFYEVEVALEGSHLVWFWWWKAHTLDARWADFVMAKRQCFFPEPKTYYVQENFAKKIEVVKTMTCATQPPPPLPREEGNGTNLQPLPESLVQDSRSAIVGSVAEVEEWR